MPSTLSNLMTRLGCRFTTRPPSSPLHGRRLEPDAAPALLLGEEAQLHLAEVGDAAAVRCQVARTLL
eukprot:8456303-Alexandrium_andersonii.AAC.1